jgi:hypothetical protein
MGALRRLLISVESAFAMMPKLVAAEGFAHNWQK